MNPETLQRPASRREPPQSDTPAVTTTPPPGGTAAAAEQAKESVSRQAHQVAADLKEGGTQAFEAAKSAGTGFVRQQQAKIASRIDEYADAVNAACESLKSDGSNPLAGPAEQASRQLLRASDYLRNNDPDRFLEDLGGFARRKPEVFYGAMFIAGLAAVRFLKASSREHYERERIRRSERYDYYRPEPGYGDTGTVRSESAPLAPAPTPLSTNPSFQP